MLVTVSYSRHNNLLENVFPWHQETLLFNADKYFEQLIFELNSAVKSIEIECYIFAQDTLGRQIITCLINAAKKGVNVKVIIDGVGSMIWDSEHIKELCHHGINVKVYHPLPWRVSLYQGIRIKKTVLSKFVDLLSNINKRDHRKLYIIDQKTAWSGSLNLCADHLPGTTQTVQNKDWFDCGVRLTGKPVFNLSESFNEVWQTTYRYTPGRKKLPFRTNNNLFRRQLKNIELVKLMKTSKQRIWIISAYLVPSWRIISALKKARLQGVDVKLLISRHSDIIFFPLISTTYYKLLLKFGIEIYECNHHIIHAKTILLDNLLMVGSSNLNHRSFLHDLELDIFLTQQQSIQQMEQKFNQLIAHSDRVDHNRLLSQPWYYQILGKILWWFRYWL